MRSSGCDGNSMRSAYATLLCVVVIWALSPAVNKLLYAYTSPTVTSVLVAFFSFLALLVYCRRELSCLDKRYFAVAVPTGLAKALASLVQKVGLLYTTPAAYAFLENLSCVIVPILMFCFIRKRPSLLTVLSSCLCLFGAFVLCGVGVGDLRFGIGEALCALAGVGYAFNIAGTGCFARDLKPSLYVLIHMGVSTLVSLASTVLFGRIEFGGAPIAPVYFSFLSLPIILLLALVSNVLCWILRTRSITRINPSTVAVIMPLSAVLATSFSILLGTDTFSVDLLLGGGIILASILLSTLGDRLDGGRYPKKAGNLPDKKHSKEKDDGKKRTA